MNFVVRIEGRGRNDDKGGQEGTVRRERPQG